MIKEEIIQEGIKDIILKNDHVELHVSNFGCTILKFIVKDKDGKDCNIVLGYDDFTKYQTLDACLGALIGRVANRIGGASFTLNDKTYNLAVNNGPNCLHGGIKGFAYRIFDYEVLEDAVRFHYISKDGEENFPGTLDFYATYTLLDDGLEIHYEATSDKDTIINITNHSYFNLSGEPCNIDEHVLQVCSSHYAPVDSDGLVTGEIVNSIGTPFDFNEPKAIKEQIYADDEQLKTALGYDHPFIFDAKEDQVKLSYQPTGLMLTVSTTLPQAQLYSANYLDGRIGRGKPMNKRDALCIETQNMPDSIHNEENPTVILRKGEKYDERTSYRVSYVS